MPFIIKNGKYYGSGGGSGDSSIDITQAEYDELVSTNSIQKDVTYYITDSKDECDASFIEYDNTESGLESDNVQNAIDELGEQISEQNKNFGVFKISTAEVKLDKTSQTNTYQTNITYDKYCCIGLTFEFGSTIVPSTDGIIGWSLSKEGSLNIVKSTMSYGGENKIYVTVIHD